MQDALGERMLMNDDVNDDVNVNRCTGNSDRSQWHFTDWDASGNA